MKNFDYAAVGSAQPSWIHAVGPILILIVLWSIFWKGLALWHSARRGQVVWFVVFTFINTAGILELVYLFGVLKLKFSELFSKKK